MRTRQRILGITVVLLGAGTANYLAQVLPPKEAPPVRPLSEGAVARLGKVSSPSSGPTPDPGGVVRLVPSPDRKRVAVGHEDKSLIVWDLETRQQVAQMAGPMGPLCALAFSPDGKVLAAGEGGVGGIRLWDVSTGQQVRAINTSAGTIRALAFGPGGVLISADSWDFIVWDPATGKELRRFRGEQSSMTQLAVAPDGRTLVSAGNGALSFWDPGSGTLLWTLGERQSWSPFAVFSPDGNTLATAAATVGGERAEDTGILLWEMLTRQVRARLRGHRQPPRAVAFAPDGRLLASLAEDAIRLWDPFTGKQVGQFQGDAGRLVGLTFSTDGKTLITAGADATVLIWDIAGRFPPAKAPGRLSTEELSRLWEALGSPDAAVACRAIGTLIGHPDQAVPMLRQGLAQRPWATPQRLARLIADLDDDEFEVREKASEQLARMGVDAEEALQRALRQPPSPEVALRTRLLLEQLQDRRISGDRVLRLRIVEVLERTPTPEARQLLQSLSTQTLGEAARMALRRLEKQAGKS